MVVFLQPASCCGSQLLKQFIPVLCHENDGLILQVCSLSAFVIAIAKSCMRVCVFFGQQAGVIVELLGKFSVCVLCHASNGLVVHLVPVSSNCSC
jgi:hypothetical protein